MTREKVDRFERLTNSEMSVLDKAEQKELSVELKDPATDSLMEALKILDHIEEQKAKLEAKEREQEQSQLSERVSDVIAEFTGSITFVILHIVIFAAYILMNLRPGWFGISPFDPFPFLFMTLAVSLEAILLSAFILISQNRQSTRDRRRDEIDFERDRLDLKVDTLAAETIREAAVRIRNIEILLAEMNSKLGTTKNKQVSRTTKQNERNVVRNTTRRKRK